MSFNISLIPITEDHTELIVKWKNRNHVKEQVFNQSEVTFETHNYWLKHVVQKELAFQFIILLNETTPIGSTFIKNIDYKNKKAEFGIFIGESEYIGKGIGKIATKLTLSYAFEVIKLHKVFLYVFSKNVSAINAYLGAGFVKEGILRHDIYLNIFYDVWIMSILEHEWREL
jgi:UDP-4-amino-4,6-dideoxy-N-acetyl-beta-L-altrosamine N-acetyltransferase